MAFSYLTFQTLSGSSGGTSTAIDTTNAELFVIIATVGTGGDPDAFTDSESNTWSSTAARTDSAVGWATQLSYCINPTTNSSHTFTFSPGTNTYGWFCVMAFDADGTVTLIDNDQAQANTLSSSPTADGQLAVGGGFDVFGDSYTMTVLTEVADDGDTGSVDIGGCAGYLIQGTQATVTPVFTSVGGFPSWATTLAIFNDSGGATSATATPSAVSVSASIPAVSPVPKNATVTPAAVSCTVAVAGGTVSASTTVAAIAVAVTSTVGAPAMIGGATIAAATVAGTVSLPPPTLSAGSTIAATAVALTASVGTPAVSAGSTIAAAAVNTTAAVGTATVGASTTIAATAVAAVSSIPTPTVEGSGATSATATPAAVNVTASVGTPALAGGATIAATAVNVTAAVGTPTVSAGATIAATAVNVVASVGAPTPSAGSTIAATAVNVVVTVSSPGRQYARAHAVHFVPAESRSYTIAADDRVSIIPAEPRSLEIPDGS